MEVYCKLLKNYFVNVKIYGRMFLLLTCSSTFICERIIPSMKGSLNYFVLLYSIDYKHMKMYYWKMLKDDFVEIIRPYNI